MCMHKQHIASLPSLFILKIKYSYPYMKLYIHEPTSLRKIKKIRIIFQLINKI